MASVYPKEELAALAMVICSQEKNLGVWTVEKAGRTEKVATAIEWDIDEDSEEKRQEVAEEFLKDLRKRILDQFPNGKILKGSLNVFDDPAVHRSAKYGFYGWLEIVP